MHDHPGNHVAKLRELATALARDAIFDKDKLIRSSLSGRENTGSSEKKKLDYVHKNSCARRPTMQILILSKYVSSQYQSLAKVR